MQKNRICDICNFKCKNKETEVAKKNILRSMGMVVKNLDNKVKQLKNSEGNKVIYLTTLRSRLSNIEANIHKEVETLEQSLKQLKSLQNSKLLEKQNLEIHIKKRQEVFRLSELEKQKILSEVEILKYEANTLEQRYVDRIQKKEQLVSLLRDMNDVRESIRSTIGGFIGNVGDFRNKDLQHLRMAMDHEKRKPDGQQALKNQKKPNLNDLMEEDWANRPKSKSEAPMYRLTRGQGMDLGAQSNEDMIQDLFQVESNMISELMRRSAGVLEMDHDLMIKKYEDNYQQQMDHFNKVNEKFQREVKSEIDTIPRGMMAQHLDMS